MPESIGATIGWSQHPDAVQAGKEAAEAALNRLSSLRPALAIVFGSSWFNQVQLLQGVRSMLGTLPIAGESTAGEIVPRGPASRSCVVLLLACDALTCSLGLGKDLDRAPREAGQRAAFSAMREFHGISRAGFLVFGDGLSTNYAEVVRGIRESLGTSFLIVGGLAGDDGRYLQTYQYCHQRVVSRSIVGVLLGGPIKLGVGLEHGFAPISKPRRVTRAHANVLDELDDRPAAAVYEEYFGSDLVQRMRHEGARQAMAYPLGLQDETHEGWLLRNVLSFGDDGSLTCSGELLEGAWLQVMIGQKELALEAARKAARDAVQSLSHVGCVLIFDSAIRRKLLGAEQAAAEISEIRKIIGVSTPLAGCYTYGEQTTQSHIGSVLLVAIGM